MEQNESSQAKTVPARARRGAETPLRWDWVEETIWTGRMLAALEEGVRGGRWYSLMDKVYRETNLMSALKSVVRNQGGSGVDNQKVSVLKARAPQIVAQLSQALREGSYEPLPVKRVWIPKAGSKELRPLGVPTVQDRVVQTALRSVLEPIFEHGFAGHSYGFRPKRSAHQALRRVNLLLQQGLVYVVDADLKGYFDSIPQDRLLAAVAEKVSDGAVMTLLRQFLEQGVMDSVKGWQPTERGTPQGAVISPLLANLYLNPLDHLMAEKGFEMVRYADDFVILCRSAEEAQQALEMVRQWVEGAGLTLHPTKTRLINAMEPGGFDFLGYHFERGFYWPRDKSVNKLKETIRAKTLRTSGQSLGTIIEGLNRTLRGWNGYFRYACGSIHDELNGWIRDRLRAILKKRKKEPGHPRGADHQKWPIAYFDRLGLFALRADPQRLLPIPEAGF